MTSKQETQDDDMNCGLTMDERDVLQAGLQALPDTMPPREVWRRIERQASAEGLFRPPGMGRRMRWMSGAGIAAAVVLAVLTVPGPRIGSGPAITQADNELPTEPPYQENTADSQLRTINALMVQSRVLERDLRRLPAAPQLMQVGTTATIEDLQNRIAAIDFQLNRPGAQMPREQQEIYWRERVRLMDSLVRLRLAQTQRGSI